MRLCLRILCLGVLDRRFHIAGGRGTGDFDGDRKLPRRKARMEGVLVSAKKVGGTITVTVVSNHDGRYAFTAGQLPPGEYDLCIRATGYEMANAKQDGNGWQGKKPGRHSPASRARLTSQLTDAEWLMSMFRERSRKRN